MVKTLDQIINEERNLFRPFMDKARKNGRVIIPVNTINNEWVVVYSNFKTTFKLVYIDDFQREQECYGSFNEILDFIIMHLREYRL